MEPLKNIIQTLENMADVHKRLLELAKKKRNHLIDGNMTELQNIIYRESSCIEEIQKLEEQRVQFVQGYMERKGYSGHRFSIEELLNVQHNSADKTALTHAARQLRGLVQEISVLNESNQQLIQASLSYTQFSLGIYLQKEPTIGYGPNAANRYLNMLDAKI